MIRLGVWVGEQWTGARLVWRWSVFDGDGLILESGECVTEEEASAGADEAIERALFRSSSCVAAGE